ncbi:hypothetical protein RBB50_012463 [Rhinocladiella similis]
MAWLQFLKAHHPDYRYVAISDDRIRALPLDGDLSSSFPIIVDDTSVEEELPVPGPLSDKNSPGRPIYLE